MNNIEIMSDAIKQIVKLKGTMVFENSKLFCAMIDDMVSKLTKERKVFRKVLDDNILREIGILYNTYPTQWSTAWAKIKYKLIEEYGLNNEWCNIIISSFSGAFGQENSIKKWNDIHYSKKCMVSNVARSFEWYQKLAEQGDAEAQYKLGNMYCDGKGVEKDFEKAVKWYKKAAVQGHARAQFSLGLAYEIELEEKKAIEWYEKAAELGEIKAQERLVYGYGIDKWRENVMNVIKWNQ